jgi:F0F1-type ATP synthase alpha subunit
MSLQKLKSELESLISNADTNIEIRSSGTVTKVYDDIAEVIGLSEVKSMEMLDFESGAKGIAYRRAYVEARLGLHW